MLNDAKLRHAKPRDKAYKLTDSHSLYLLVKQNGGRLWRWNYVYGDKQKTMSFGAYPMVSLVQARAKRDEARAILDDGKDPAVVKKLTIEANRTAAACTFERVAKDWHDTFKSQWASVHADDILRSLKRDVFPAIGQFPIGDIEPPIILKVLREIEARGSIETAKRVRQRISSVFIFAIGEGVAKSDPAEKLGAVLKPLRKGRQPAITDLSELRQMICKAEEDHARPVTRLALRFLALTAVRPGELRGARWDECEDLNGKEPLWRIPAQRMKGDYDRKHEEGGDHLVPLSRQSVAILRALWPLTGACPLLFPSNRHGHRPMSENAIGYLLNRAGYHGHHVPHGFRAAFSTIMNEWAEQNGKEHDRQVIDLMLAHVPPKKSEGAYNRAAYMPRRRKLAQLWADMLTETLPSPVVLVERPTKPVGDHSRRRVPKPVAEDFRFPSSADAA